MSDTDPREPQPIGMEQRPAQAVEAPQLPSPPADQNADLVEMLWAADPSMDAAWIKNHIVVRCRFILLTDHFLRLLAWANARRDAAVGEKDAQIARLRETLEHATTEPCGDYLAGLRCGVEDRCITNRYQAAEYGWEQAFEYVRSCLPEGGDIAALSDTEARDG